MDEPSEERPDALPPFVAEWLEAQPVPNYRLGEPLAWRENVAVFRARDQRLERDVALKIMRPARAPSGEAIERFFDEARGVARLRAPGLVRALDVGRAGPLFFFASRYLRGESLAARMVRRERARWLEKDVLRLMLSVAHALRDLYEHGMGHRRLAPGNLLRDESARRWVIADVGCDTGILYADALSSHRARPWYLAPEQVDDDPVIDIRADLYALGAIGYHCLFGASPFAPENGDIDADVLLDRHRRAPLEDPRERDPRLSAATARLLTNLLEKDRDERPRSPKILLARLARHPLLEGDSPEGDGDTPPSGAVDASAEDADGGGDVDSDVSASE